MPELDSLMQDQAPTGSKSSMKSNKYDSTMTSDCGSEPSPSEGAGSQRHPNVQDASLNKAADNGIISPAFYADVSGSPGTFDSTMQSVLEISFNR